MRYAVDKPVRAKDPPRHAETVGVLSQAASGRFAALPAKRDPAYDDGLREAPPVGVSLLLRI